MTRGKGFSGCAENGGGRSLKYLKTRWCNVSGLTRNCKIAMVQSARTNDLCDRRCYASSGADICTRNNCNCDALQQAGHARSRCDQIGMCASVITQDSPFGRRMLDGGVGWLDGGE